MKMGYVLGAVMVVAGGAALYGGSSRPTRPEAEPPAALPAAAVPPVETPSGGAEVLEGQVLETMDAAGYTYLRVGAPGSEGRWAAVTATALKVGDRVRIRSDALMQDFESKTLKRRFAVIHFGTLETGPAGSLPPGHPSPGASAAIPPGHPGATAMPPGHRSADTSAAPLEIGKVERASGPTGRTVAEIFAQKATLAGKKVRVRGVVVKATHGVMGKSFLHLRDGSGAEATRNNDLTVTTAEEHARGATVLLEGTVVLDRDLGAGYRYDVLLEDATSVK